MPNKLGLLYRKYLRGSDLTAPVTVDILGFRQVQVQPHPSAPAVAKWCLFVQPFDDNLPNAVLIGPKAEDDLLKIFGSVDLDTLKGKKVTLRPEKYNIAGNSRSGIRFSPPAAPAKPNASRLVAPEPAPPLPPQPPEEYPF